MAYTYLIGWKTLGLYYYGVRYARGCSPADLWTTYFTSSKHVADVRKYFGDPDIIQIRKEFECGEAARLWESTVLRRMKVIHRQDFLNQTNNSAISPEAALRGSKKIRSPEIKARQRERYRAKTVGVPKSDQHKQAMSIAKLGIVVGEKNNFYGKTHSDESKQKMSVSKSKMYVGAGNPNSKNWAIEFPDGSIQTISCLKSFASSIGQSIKKVRYNRTEYKVIGIV